MAKPVAKQEPTPVKFNQFSPELQLELDSMGHNERIEWLNDNSHSVKEEEYRAPLTGEELDEVKARVTLLSVQLQEIEDRKKLLMDEIKAELKMVQEPLQEAVREARNGERIGFGKVWYMPDVAAKVTYKVADGTVIGQRPIRSEELQGRLTVSHNFGN